MGAMLRSLGIRHELVDPPPDQLLGRIPGHGAQLLVDIIDPAVEVDDHDPVRQQVEDRPPNRIRGRPEQSHSGSE